jgi:hypothetical protein
VIGIVGGVITGLLLERRREKAKRLTIVDALIVETAENLTIYKSPEIRKIWWTAPYKLEAYRAYKGQIFFLPRDVTTKLIASMLSLEGCNIDIQKHLSQVASGQPANAFHLKPTKAVIEGLEFVDEELRKWREEHTR